MRIVNKIICARQYHDGNTKEYKTQVTPKGNPIPYKVIVGVCTKRLDKILHSMIEVIDGTGRKHYFYGNFNYEILENIQEIVKATKECYDNEVKKND